MILVTGANGFVGSALVARLVRDGHPVRVAVRDPTARFPAGVDCHVLPLTGESSRWDAALSGVGTVVHLAARVHQLHDKAADPFAVFRSVNVDATRLLALQAARAGVEHFIFMSSVKVLGEVTAPGQPFTSRSVPMPMDPYGRSKWEAEQVLCELERQGGCRVSIVRPPLVYGPGVRANFRNLMQLVARGVPLPFARCDNRRSLVALDNLTDLLATLVRRPAAAGRIWLVSDNQDLSTPALIRHVAAAMGQRSRLFPVPISVLRGLARLTGRAPQLQRTLGSLQVDVGETRSELQWEPPVTVEAAMRRTVQAFLDEAHS